MTIQTAPALCVCVAHASHLDGAEIHGVFDYVVVVVQAQRWRVHGFVEGPGVRCVFFGQQFFKDAAAVAKLLA